MIEFNKNLESLSTSQSVVNRLRKVFLLKSAEELINIVSLLDSERKGYVTPNQILKYPSNQFLIFLNNKFQARISYSMLASYLLSGQNDNVKEINHIQQISCDNISQYLINQHLMAQFKKQIINSMNKYVISSCGKIFYQQFEDYCHSQKLALNPIKIFKLLSNGDNFISLPLSQKQYQKQRKDNKEETLAKIKKLQTCLQRLDQRVQKFGAEWL